MHRVLGHRTLALYRQGFFSWTEPVASLIAAILDGQYRLVIVQDRLHNAHRPPPNNRMSAMAPTEAVMKILLPVLTLFLFAPLAWGQSPRIFSRSNCNTIASPVVGQTLCFDRTANQLKFWDGSTWTLETRVD